jgi:competence ComEA-like helix-hairpin-helix protein
MRRESTRGPQFRSIADASWIIISAIVYMRRSLNMNHAPSSSFGLGASVLLASALLAAAPLRPSAGRQPPVGAADDQGAVLLSQMCSECHDVARIVSHRQTKAGWQDAINQMIEKGASGTGTDFQRVFEYLVLDYGTVYVNSAPPDEIAMALGLSTKDAEALVAYRKANGPFPDVEAVRKVPGIDVKKLDEHKDAIAF